jgi:hypothetical protein
MAGRLIWPAAMRGAFPDEMKLLLAHNPIILRQAARAEIDLVLSGHTHGGQVKMKVREPEKRLLPRRKLSSGLHSNRDTQIYITRGIRHGRFAGSLSMPAGNFSARTALRVKNQLRINNYELRMRRKCFSLFFNIYFPCFSLYKKNAFSFIIRNFVIRNS